MGGLATDAEGRFADILMADVLTSYAKPLGDLLPAPTLEFFFDTARAVVNLFVRGTVDRCPDVSFIIPHVGGALPPLLTRFVTLSTLIPGQVSP